MPIQSYIAYIAQHNESSYTKHFSLLQSLPTDSLTPITPTNLARCSIFIRTLPIINRYTHHMPLSHSVEIDSWACEVLFAVDVPLDDSYDEDEEEGYHAIVYFVG